MTLAAINLDIGDALGALIWIVIFLVWLVGKGVAALQQSRKGGKGPPDAETAPAGPTGADELKEFLETLTGQKVATPEREERRIELPPPAPPPAPAHRYAPRPPAATVGVGKVEERMKVFRPTQVKGTDALLVGLRSLRQPGASLPKADLWTSTRKHVPAGLADRRDLRRAMVQRIILSPPVALGGKLSSPDLTEY